MKKMKVGDYIMTKDIPDQETLDHIRECVKKMGYEVSNYFGKKHSRGVEWDFLQLHEDGDLIFSNALYPRTNCYTPQEIFAMIEAPDMKEDIKQTIDRMKQEIATLEEQLKESKPEVTYKAGDRFYLNGVTTNEFILSTVGLAGSRNALMALISIHDGNRWENFQPVHDHLNVTIAEMNKLTAGADFVLKK